MTVSAVCSRVGPRPYKYGREQWGVIILMPAWDLWSYILRNSYIDPICHSQVTRKSLLKLLCPSYMWLGKSCHSGDISRVTCDWLTSVPSDIRVLEWLTTNLWGTCNRHTSQPSVGHSGKVSRPFGTVPYGRGTCAERRRSPPPELLRVFRSRLRHSDKKHKRHLRSCRPTPSSNCNFDQYLFVNNSQVPWDFGVTTT